MRLLVKYSLRKRFLDNPFLLVIPASIVGGILIIGLWIYSSLKYENYMFIIFSLIILFFFVKNMWNILLKIFGFEVIEVSFNTLKYTLTLFGLRKTTIYKFDDIYEPEVMDFKSDLNERSNRLQDGLSDFSISFLDLNTTKKIRIGNYLNSEQANQIVDELNKKVESISEYDQ